ncbi:hypothetical protein THAOC_31806, partial [Thalassiosira oceanica]
MTVAAPAAYASAVQPSPSMDWSMAGYPLLVLLSPAQASRRGEGVSSSAAEGLAGTLVALGPTGRPEGAAPERQHGGHLRCSARTGSARARRTIEVSTRMDPPGIVHAGMDPPGVVYAGRNARPTRVVSLSRIFLAIVLIGAGSVALHFRAVLSVIDTTRSGTVDGLPRAERRRVDVAANKLARAEEEAGDAPSNEGQASNNFTVGGVATDDPGVVAAGGDDGKERDTNESSMTLDHKPAKPRVDESEAAANDAVDHDVANDELAASMARSKSRKASNNGTEAVSAVEQERSDRSDVTMPAAIRDGLADLNSHGYPSATPVYWRVPKAGGTTAQVILAKCLGLVVACESGPVLEARRRNETGGAGPRTRCG